MVWEEAFEYGTGLPLKDFYVLFDKAYQNIFNSNEDLKTYLNRECPGQWNCYVQRGSEDFDQIAEGIQAESEEKYGRDSCDGEWWTCIEIDVELPDQAENSDHGAPLDVEAMFHISSCDELLEGELREFGGVKLPIAASFDYAESIDSDVIVSTQWYSTWFHLDTNADGIVCGPGDDG
jgi:hypothetical protein